MYNLNSKVEHILRRCRNRKKDINCYVRMGLVSVLTKLVEHFNNDQLKAYLTKNHKSLNINIDY